MSESPTRAKEVVTPRLHNPTPWRLLVLLVAMTAIAPTALNILVPAIPTMAVQLDTDPAVVQMTVSLFLVGMGVAQLLLGALSDRFGRRPVIFIGLALTALTSFAAMAATSLTALIAVRTAQAFGASTGMVVGRAIIRDLYDRDRAAAMMGWVTMSVVIAPMLAPLLGGVLDVAFGWRSIFAFLGIVSAVVLVWAAVALPETRPARPSHGGGVRLLAEGRALFANRSFNGYVLCGGLGCAPFFSFLGGGPYVVIDIMGRSSAEFGVWFAITSSGYMAGNFVAARLSQRVGVDAMIRWGLILEVIGGVITVLVAVFDPDAGPAPIFIPQILIQLGNGMLLPNAIAGAVSVRPQAAGTAAGIIGFAQMGIGALAAQSITYIVVGAADPLSLALTMLIYAAVALGTYCALMHRR